MPTLTSRPTNTTLTVAAIEAGKIPLAAFRQVPKVDQLFNALQQNQELRAQLATQLNLNAALTEENVRQGEENARLSAELMKQHGILCRLAEACDENVTFTDEGTGIAVRVRYDCAKPAVTQSFQEVLAVTWPTMPPRSQE